MGDLRIAQFCSRLRNDSSRQLTKRRGGDGKHVMLLCARSNNTAAVNSQRTAIPYRFRQQCIFAPLCAAGAIPMLHSAALVCSKVLTRYARLRLTRDRFRRQAPLRGHDYRL
jgi:hypothetical protein